MGFTFTVGSLFVVLVILCSSYNVINVAAVLSNISISSSGHVYAYYENNGEFLPANGLARTPSMGCNSWNHYQRNVDEKAVKATESSLDASFDSACREDLSE